MRAFLYISLLALLTSCWPKSISFIDGSTPEEWEKFSLKTLENNAPNTPLSYAALLTEEVKDGIQNRSSLLLSSDPSETQIDIEGVITNYSITPVAIQNGDAAAKNRLSVSVKFTIFIKAPEEEQRMVNAVRFVDYDANTDLGVVESTLLAEVNDQIVQDVLNKLLSNW